MAVDEITVRVKKWGSSLGLVIPVEVARRQELEPGDAVRIQIERKTLRVKDVFGMLREELKDVDWDEVDRELATGWDND